MVTIAAGNKTSDVILHRVQILDQNGGFGALCDIWIEKGVVRKIGKNLPASKDVPALDGQGLWLIPGVFECHSHVGMFSSDTWENLQTPYSLRVFETEHNLNKLLQSGVTTVRDAGGIDAGVRSAQQQGLIASPQLQVSIALLCQTGGHMDTYLPGENISISTEGFMPAYPGRPKYVVDGKDEMRRAVRKLIHLGADWIKICTTGGIFSGAGGAQCKQFSREEVEVAVFEAKKANRPVMCHAVGGDGITDAVLAGVRSIEHGIYLTEQQAALMAERGTFLVPTLTCYHRLIQLAHMPESPLPPALVVSAEKLEKQLGASVRLADAFGIPIALGTDAAERNCHGNSLEEIFWLWKAGLSVEKALLAATFQGAELCGVSDRLGRIQEGYQFDAVLLTKDPAHPEEFLQPEMVGAVFQGGRRVKSFTQWQ